MGRPKLYTNEAARMAAYRARNWRVDLALPKEMGNTLEEIAKKLDVKPAQLCESMLKFALTNRNWAALGLTHQKQT